MHRRRELVERTLRQLRQLSAHLHGLPLAILNVTLVQRRCDSPQGRYADRP